MLEEATPPRRWCTGKLWCHIIASFLYVYTCLVRYRQLLAGHGYYSVSGSEQRSFSKCGCFHVGPFYNVFWSCCCLNRIQCSGWPNCVAAYKTMSQKHEPRFNGGAFYYHCHWPGRINMVSKHVASMDDCINACVPVWLLDTVNHQNGDWERLVSKAVAKTIKKLQVGCSWCWKKKYRRWESLS